MVSIFNNKRTTTVKTLSEKRLCYHTKQKPNYLLTCILVSPFWASSYLGNLDSVSYAISALTISKFANINLLVPCMNSICILPFLSHRIFAFYIMSSQFMYIQFLRKQNCLLYNRTDLLNSLQSFWMRNFVLGIRVPLKRNWRAHLIKSWFCSGLYRYVWFVNGRVSCS